MKLFTWLMMILSQMAVTMYLCLQHHTLPVLSPATTISQNVSGAVTQVCIQKS